MDSESTNPLTARNRFASKPIHDLIKLFFIFVGLLAIFSAIAYSLHSGAIPFLITNAVALGIVGYLYFQWEKVPIKIACDSCRKIILSNTPWVCRACGHKNLDTKNYPFVFQCEKCGVEPKAYRCHHKKSSGEFCGGMIYFTEDQDENNFAQNVTANFEAPVTDKHAQNLKDLSEQKATKLAERELALVEEDLDRIQKRIHDEKDKKRTAKEEVAADVAYMMELEETEAELLSDVEEKYKNNKPMLKRMKLAIKQSIQSKKSTRM